MEGESLESCSDTKSNLVPRELAPSSTLPGVLETLLGAQDNELVRGEGDRGDSIQYSGQGSDTGVRLLLIH